MSKEPRTSQCVQYPFCSSNIENLFILSMLITNQIRNITTTITLVIMLIFKLDFDEFANSNDKRKSPYMPIL